MNTELNLCHFEKFPELESERLICRKILLSDAPYLFAIRSDDEIMEYMDTPKMITLNDSEKFITSIYNDYSHKKGITWAIADKISGSFIGYFSFGISSRNIAGRKSVMR